MLTGRPGMMGEFVLGWAQVRDRPEAWASSSVGGAAGHLNDDVQDAVDLGLDGRCDEEEDGSTRAGALRFSLRSGCRQGEEVNVKHQSATHKRDGHHQEPVHLEHCQQHALVTTTYRACCWSRGRSLLESHAGQHENSRELRRRNPCGLTFWAGGRHRKKVHPGIKSGHYDA